MARGGTAGGRGGRRRGGTAPHDQVEGGAESAAATYIRPYAWTGGRTRSNHRLELETLVSTSEMCRPRCCSGWSTTR
ncbi:DUF742 domain-containing protein [Saccharopolyspora spinosporotrichia]